MNIQPIITDADYRHALKQIESFMLAELNSPEGEMLNVLATLVEAYERKHYPLDLLWQGAGEEFLLLKGMPENDFDKNEWRW